MTITDTRHIIRQGDVLLLPITDNELPAKRTAVPTENGRVVLAHGEATGHHHSFAVHDRIALFREDGSGGGLYLAVSGDAPAALEHQEHSALSIAPGSYQVIRQREWSDADEPIQVED